MPLSTKLIFVGGGLVALAVMLSFLLFIVRKWTRYKIERDLSKEALDKYRMWAEEYAKALRKNKEVYEKQKVSKTVEPSGFNRLFPPK